MSKQTAKPRILLVEDDETLAGIYTLRMETEGFEVIHRSDGESALDAAKAYKPDVILLDIMIPRLGGFDVLEILRRSRESRKTKIIMLSVLSHSDDIAKAKGLGADDFIVKSQVVLDDVISRLRHTLGLPVSAAP